ncbi:hypothetical protein AVEN_110738-1 [Araneus ventricosus]|uniref:Uncharacterized protein n=1 Tax=Araneus ventricosus TaxID=182803 RepID=A0A4Y2U2C0_ARAVE|nr:hypothetical protein AVEN_110738-1 [Araneus ventricosus]
MAVLDPHTPHKLLRDIQSLLTENRNILARYFKAQVGYRGNEEADTLAEKTITEGVFNSNFTCGDPTILPYELIRVRNRVTIDLNVRLTRAWQVLDVYASRLITLTPPEYGATKGWSDEDAGRKVEVWLDLNSLIAGGRACSVTEVANYENVAQDCGNGTKALDSTEKIIEGTKKTINWNLDGKDWFLFGEIGANYVSSFLTLNCWLRCGTILADVVGWAVSYGRRL